MRATTSLALLAAVAAALCTSSVVQAQPRPPRRPPPQLGDPLRRLSPSEHAAFDAGKDAFEEVEDSEDGLGPVFNDVSCEKCHNVPATGGGSERLEIRFGTTTAGAFDPLAQFGGSLIQENGIGAVAACEYVEETVPAAATIVAQRRTTPLFGLGLVDAVPDRTFHRLAERQRRRSPETAGRPNMVSDVVSGATVVGKFGWKAQVPSLAQFSGDAYLNEMGITSPMFPAENCPQGDCTALACDPVADPEDDGEDVELFDHFMSLLAAPAPLPRNRTTAAGASAFKSIGCATCHVRTLHTARNETRALSRVAFHPYSDFLLHDMGALGDGIAQGGASGREMRTAPLWGLRAITTFLHDGRAITIEGAILAHDGQARRARDLFASLPPQRKQALLEFLRGL